MCLTGALLDRLTHHVHGSLENRCIDGKQITPTAEKKLRRTP